MPGDVCGTPRMSTLLSRLHQFRCSGAAVRKAAAGSGHVHAAVGGSARPHSCSSLLFRPQFCVSYCAGTDHDICKNRAERLGADVPGITAGTGRGFRCGALGFRCCKALGAAKVLQRFCAFLLAFYAALPCTAPKP